MGSEMKIRNVSRGPRGLNTVDGSVLLHPGQEVEAEMNEAEHQVAYGTGWFEMPAPEGETSPAKERAGKKE
jgi:hypothetical protein